MDLSKSTEVIMALRESLEPVESASTLVDGLEGYQPAARKAAVLLGLFDQQNETHLAFIRRASTLRAHSGEIAFPGGSVEPGDIALAMTALRGGVRAGIGDREEWMRDGRTRTVYFYDYGPYRIWGATARMLNALLELLR